MEGEADDPSAAHSRRLLEALSAVHAQGPDPLLTRFGGHAHAVGFSLLSGQVGELRERMAKYALLRLDPAVEDEIACDAELQLAELTPEFLATLEQLGPFGAGNAEPIFVSYGVRLAAALKTVEEQAGKGFGDAKNPLLVSVRSGAAVSMPGMMETVLDVGLNRETVEALIRQTGNPRLAWDSFRRLVQGYAEVVANLPAAPFDGRPLSHRLLSARRASEQGRLDRL